MTDRASFSRLLRQLARKWSGSILTTLEPTQGDRLHESRFTHGSLSAVMHAPVMRYALMLRPASQAGPMHESAGVGEVS